MICRVLGRTGLEVSRLALGGGGPSFFGQHAGVAESEIHRLIHRALDLSINLFDSAPYNADYLHSEGILGRALWDVPRDRYHLSTKVALLRPGVAGPCSPDEIIASAEESLRCLKTDHLDLLLTAAGPLPACMPLADQLLEHAAAAFERLRRSGKVRFLGATEASSSDGAHRWLARALEGDLFDVVMVAYNLLNQSAERSIFPLCREKNVGTLAIFTVRKVFSDRGRLGDVIRELMQRGLLEEDAVPDDDPLGWLLEGPEDSMVRAAYRFAAGNDAVTAVLTGTVNPRHLEQNARTIQEGALPAEKVARLRELFGHITEPIGN